MTPNASSSKWVHTPMMNCQPTLSIQIEIFLWIYKIIKFLRFTSVGNIKNKSTYQTENTIKSKARARQIFIIRWHYSVVLLTCSVSPLPISAINSGRKVCMSTEKQLLTLRIIYYILSPVVGNLCHSGSRKNECVAKYPCILDCCFRFVLALLVAIRSLTKVVNACNNRITPIIQLYNTTNHTLIRPSSTLIIIWQKYFRE